MKFKCLFLSFLLLFSINLCSMKKGFLPNPEVDYSSDEDNIIDLNFQNSNESSDSSESEDDVPNIFSGDNVIQFRVLDQRLGNGGGIASCGYHSLKNGLIISSILCKQSLASELRDSSKVEALFGDKTKSWRLNIINLRAKKLASYFIRDSLLKSLNGAEIVSLKRSEKNYFKLNLKDAYVHFPSDNSSDLKESERNAIIDLLVDVANDLVEEKILFLSENKEKSSRQIHAGHIINKVRYYARKRFKNCGREVFKIISKSKKLSQYFSQLRDINFSVGDDCYLIDHSKGTLKRFLKELEIVKNEKHNYLALTHLADAFYDLNNDNDRKIAIKAANKSNVSIPTVNMDLESSSDSSLIDELISSKNKVFRYNWCLANNFIERSDYNLKSETYLPGEWLSSKEIEKLAKAYRNVTLKNDLGNQYLPIFVIDGDISKAFKLRNDLRLLKNTVTNPEYSGITILIINIGNHWIACVLNKRRNERVQFLLADSLNNNLKDSYFLKILVNNLCTIKIKKEKKIRSSVDKKTTKSNKKTARNEALHNFLNKKLDKNSYRSPYASKNTSELPSLSDLFFGKIPSAVKNFINMIKNSKSYGTIKNCLILSGPPGTGKSLVAEHIARASKLEYLFIAGGAFGDRYKNSEKEDFADLLKNILKLDRSLVIIFDEFDASASVNDNDNQDSRRAVNFMKSFLNHLENQSDNPLYFVCTTNYFSSIEDGIKRRATVISIDAPDENQRKKLIKYFLDKKNIPIESDKNTIDKKTKESEFFVTEKFTNLLVDETEDFTGSYFKDMIYNAHLNMKEGYEPNKIMSHYFGRTTVPGCRFIAKSFVGHTANKLENHIYSEYSNIYKNIIYIQNKKRNGVKNPSKCPYEFRSAQKNAKNQKTCRKTAWEGTKVTAAFAGTVASGILTGIFLHKKGYCSHGTGSTSNDNEKK